MEGTDTTFSWDSIAFNKSNIINKFKNLNLFTEEQREKIIASTVIISAALLVISRLLGWI